MSRYIDVEYVRYEDVKVGDVIASMPSGDTMNANPVKLYWQVVTDVKIGYRQLKDYFHENYSAAQCAKIEQTPEVTITLSEGEVRKDAPLRLLAIQVVRER